jgi:hypothetical protein
MRGEARGERGERKEEEEEKQREAAGKPSRIPAESKC